MEKALVKVQNEVPRALDGQQSVILLLPLNLSAEFDTVDHAILLTRLSQRVGIKSTALNWFSSHLSEWGHMYVSMGPHPGIVIYPTRSTRFHSWPCAISDV